MSGKEEMATVKNTTLVNRVHTTTKVRVTVVQASTVYNDTPATIEKAAKYIEEAAKDNVELVLFSEGFIGGYPRGFKFGIGVGVHNEEGRDEFRKYHASAIEVPGGSVIISPLGQVLAGPNYESEGLVTADLDLGDIARAKLYFDAVGHYSRPDVLHLTVNEDLKKNGYICVEGGESGG